MLIPRPSTLLFESGEFVIDSRTAIAAPPGLQAVALLLRGALAPATGFPLPLASDGNIRLAIDQGIGLEGYRLHASDAVVTILGGDTAGLFYGVQTLLQLLPPDIYRRARVAEIRWAIPAVKVGDRPRFGWRGIMLDVARHFLTKHEVFRFLDLMAMHRLNRLHLHLTDDQGWRVQILKYPKLTEVGGWRHETQLGAGAEAPGDGRPHGGFYSQDDIREIVAYASERFITVVPEIESPGHVQAALAAYPRLSVDGQPRKVFTRWGINPAVLNMEESTVEFFTDVLDEVMELFPSKFIGVGGDECPR
ncbi:MAG: beta-N-acetylhexosaminidase, partial [Kineosporiaceae bacterium]|nr:beta-N-acetylhexosaminidase [Aeromicrobium sp.]